MKKIFHTYLVLQFILYFQLIVFFLKPFGINYDSDLGKTVSTTVNLLFYGSSVLIVFLYIKDTRFILSHIKLILVAFLVCAFSLMWSKMPDNTATRIANLLLQVCQTISIVIICKKYDLDLLKILKQSMYTIILMNVLFSIFFPSLALSKVLGEDGRFDALTPSPNNLAQLAVIAVSVWLPRNIQDYSFKTISLILMSVFCLYLSGSATGLVSILLIVFINFSLVFKRKIVWFVGIGVFYISFFLLQVIGIGEEFSFFKLLNRDANLTGRTLIWNYALTEIVKDDRVSIGYGAGGFWDPTGKRVHVDPFMDNFMQMHNGYIETYVQLGYFGIALLVLLLVAVIPMVQKSIKHHSMTNFSLVIIAILINNFTESSFLLPKHPNWIIFTLLYAVVSLKISTSQVKINNLKPVTTGGVLV